MLLYTLQKRKVKLKEAKQVTRREELGMGAEAKGLGRLAAPCCPYAFPEEEHSAFRLSPCDEAQTLLSTSSCSELETLL